MRVVEHVSVDSSDHSADENAQVPAIAVTRESTASADDSEYFLAFANGHEGSQVNFVEQDRHPFEDDGDPFEDGVSTSTVSADFAPGDAKVTNQSPDFLAMWTRLRDVLGAVRGKITVADVQVLAGIEHPNDSNVRLVARAMHQLGWERGRCRFSGVRRYAYLRGSEDQRCQILELERREDGQVAVRIAAPESDEFDPLGEDEPDPFCESVQARRRPRKRLPSTGDLTKRFEMRCTPQDFRRWERHARDLGLQSVAAFLRRAADDALSASTKKRDGS